MANSRDEILESYHRARAVPMMHLMEQFVNPGKKDDAKQPAIDAKDNPTTKPMLSREEAFSRLQCRIEEGLTPDDNAGCKDYLQKLNDKWSYNCSSNEKIILGLAYQHGLGGIPKNPKKALEQFKSAANKDEKNGYVFIFLMQSMRDQKQDRTDEYAKYLFQLRDAEYCGFTLAHEGISSYRYYLSLLPSKNRDDHYRAEGFYEDAQRKFEKASSQKNITLDYIIWAVCMQHTTIKQSIQKAKNF